MVSPETNTSKVDALIDILSNTNSSLDSSAIYFIGSNNDINGYGWNANVITEHNSSMMHPINAGTNINEFATGIAGVSFNGLDIYEYYKLAWTAYAVVHSTDGNLTLHYDYQPWHGERYNSPNTKKALIMQDVSTFRFMAIGSILKIQVCVQSDMTNEEYSICKEKTIY